MKAERNGLLQVAVLAASLLLSMAPAGDVEAAEIYRWVDRDGLTHYSQEPPSAVKASRIERPLTVDAASQQQAAAEAKRLIEQANRRDANKVIEQTSQQTKDGRLHETDSRVKRCDNVRRQLALLEIPVPVYKPAAEGNRVYLDDAARPAEMQRLRDEVKSQYDDPALEALDAAARRRSEAAQRPACKAAIKALSDLVAPGVRTPTRDLEQVEQSARLACNPNQ